MNKQPIRDFMQRHYTDERLAQLLVHAQDGKLAYFSCCCFIGISTADHALKSRSLKNEVKNVLNMDILKHGEVPHYDHAKDLIGANEAENAYLYLADDDATRRRIMIPMIRAEFRRRDRIRQQSEWKQELVEMST
jgi:hypothetical protein